jgi:hypothetical protein
MAVALPLFAFLTVLLLSLDAPYQDAIAWEYERLMGHETPEDKLRRTEHMRRKYGSGR